MTNCFVDSIPQIWEGKQKFEDKTTGKLVKFFSACLKSGGLLPDEGGSLERVDVP